MRGGTWRGFACPRAHVTSTVEARDRLWTLLVTRYELLWRTGAWLLGQKIDEKVPPLQSRRVKRKDESAEPETPAG
jgi:hypothetical protein